MGGKSAEQLLAQGRLLAAEGIEAIGGGGLVGKAPQQLLPEPLGAVHLAEAGGGQGIALEHHRRQGIESPALARQQRPLPAGILAGPTQQQQGRLAAQGRVGSQVQQQFQLGAGQQRIRLG